MEKVTLSFAPVPAHGDTSSPIPNSRVAPSPSHSLSLSRGTRRAWFPRSAAPYRNGAIGTRLLQHALNEGRADTFLQDAYLHVQSNNDDAIAFYTRFGFKRDQLVLNYYKRLDPPDAVVLKLDLKEWKVGGP